MTVKSFLVTSTLALTCIAMFSLHSCTKLAKNLQYDLDMQTASVDIVLPPCFDTTVTATGTQANYYNIDSFIKKYTGGVLGVTNITSAKIKTCSLTILNPNTALGIDFGNFKSINASFYTNGYTTPYTVNIPNNPATSSDVLNLPVDTTAELKNYLINGNQFTYTLGGKLRRPTEDSIHCHVEFTFKMHVQG